MTLQLLLYVTALIRPLFLHHIGLTQVCHQLGTPSSRQRCCNGNANPLHATTVLLSQMMSCQVALVYGKALLEPHTPNPTFSDSSTQINSALVFCLFFSEIDRFHASNDFV